MPWLIWRNIESADLFAASRCARSGMTRIICSLFSGIGGGDGYCRYAFVNQGDSKCSVPKAFAPEKPLSSAYLPSKARLSKHGGRKDPMVFLGSCGQVVPVKHSEPSHVELSVNYSLKSSNNFKGRASSKHKIASFSLHCKTTGMAFGDYRLFPLTHCEK